MKAHAMTFGRWTVTGYAEKRIHGAVAVKCRCACGTKRDVVLRVLMVGKTKSCGCGKVRPGSTLRKKYLVEYKAWVSMLGRCSNPKNDSWKYYGARGIAVCERWLSFDNFIEDMGPRPAGMSIDRIDNDKGYEPSNCAWATPAEQSKNRRVTWMMTYQGKRMPARDVARIIGVSRDTIVARLRRGATDEQAATVGRLVL
jgi:hypothetical protein